MFSAQLLARLRTRASLMGPVRLAKDVQVKVADSSGAILHIPSKGDLLIGTNPQALFRVQPGDLLFVPWGARHFVAASPAPTRQLDVDEVLSHRNTTLFSTLAVGKGTGAVSFLSSLSHWSDEAEPLARALLPPILHLPGAARATCAAAIIRALQTVMAEPKTSAPVVLNYLVSALLTLAIEGCGTDLRITDKLALRALALMHADTERNTLPVLAARLKVSRSTLISRFTAATGDSPAGYARRLALCRAAEALRGGATAQAACEEAGFNSAAAFQAAFRQRYGMTPATFRRAAE